MTKVSELMSWLATLPADSSVFIDYTQLQCNKTPANTYVGFRPRSEESVREELRIEALREAREENPPADKFDIQPVYQYTLRCPTPHPAKGERNLGTTVGPDGHLLYRTTGLRYGLHPSSWFKSWDIIEARLVRGGPVGRLP